MALEPKMMPSTKDMGQLSIQIDACADNLPALMIATRDQKNDALAKGLLDEADRLDDLSITYGAQLGVLIRHRLKTIDDSAEMKATIKGFAELNTQISTVIEKVKQLTEFIKQATAIANALEQLAAKALKAGM